MTVPLRTISFKLRILLVVLILIVVGIWTLAVRATAVLQDDIQQLLSEQMSATVGYVAADIDSKIRLRIDTLQGLAAAITPDLLDDPARLRGVLEQRLPSRDLFPTGVIVANAKGLTIADYPRIEVRHTWSPLFAKHSFDGGKKVKIAAIHPDSQ